VNQKEKDMLTRFDKMLHDNGASNEFLLAITSTCFDYLNPLSIPEYKTKYGMSYNGAKKCRKTTTILRKKYILDNQ
jgi:hypothetical protein